MTDRRFLVVFLVALVLMLIAWARYDHQQKRQSLEVHLRRLAAVEVEQQRLSEQASERWLTNRRDHDAIWTAVARLEHQQLKRRKPRWFRRMFDK